MLDEQSKTPETDEEWNRPDLIRPIDLANAMKEKCEKLECEKKELRKIFPQILDSLGNGSVCADDSCLEFLRKIPKEVKIVVNKLKRERNEAIDCLKDVLKAFPDLELWENYRGESLKPLADEIRRLVML